MKTCFPGRTRNTMFPLGDRDLCRCHSSLSFPVISLVSSGEEKCFTKKWLWHVLTPDGDGGHGTRCNRPTVSSLSGHRVSESPKGHLNAFNQFLRILTSQRDSKDGWKPSHVAFLWRWVAPPPAAGHALTFLFRLFRWQEGAWSHLHQVLKIHLQWSNPNQVFTRWLDHQRRSQLSTIVGIFSLRSITYLSISSFSLKTGLINICSRYHCCTWICITANSSGKQHRKPKITPTSGRFTQLYNFICLNYVTPYLFSNSRRRKKWSPGAKLALVITAIVVTSP